MKRRILRVLGWIGALLAVVLAIAVVAAWALSEPRPEGIEGPEADEMARGFARAVNADAWAATGAVRWTFAGRDTHLWDKTRGLSRVAWGDVVVLQRLDQRVGVVLERGERIHGDRAHELVEEAWARWCNDAFWLNPLVKLFDDGVTRSVVRHADGTEGLLVAYASGGVTPGDAYVWIGGGEGGLPVAWKMWVSVIPVGGVEASWEDWVTLSTGAKIATRHQLGPLTVELTDVAGAATLAELEPGEDPFALLVGD